MSRSESVAAALAARLIKVTIALLQPIGLQRVVLATLDAHDVYTLVGFVPLADPSN